MRRHRAGDGRAADGRCQHGGQVDEVRLVVVLYLYLAQAFHVANHLVHRSEAQTRHDLAQLLGHKEHEALDVLGLAGKSVAQAAVLRGDARGAGVLLAVALHKAAHGDKRHGGKAELLGAKQAGDGDVGAVHKLAVRLQHHAGAQAVLHQRLLGLGKAELKRQARMPNGVARRRSLRCDR